MIRREEILSLEYLKKTEFTGCHQGMRYRLEGADRDGGEKKLLCTVWPEPFSYSRTADEEKAREELGFDEDGIVEAIAWMNDRLISEKDRWEHAGDNWD